MSKSPEHPGNPKWKTHDEWLKAVEPRQMSMVTAATSNKELMERFGLQDESQQGDAAWGNVELDSNNQNGWGQPMFNNDW
ncbi:hypothetical protein DM01DRAFT_1331368 [Hesseltinella vesiculosa]|uniref:Uncharacterized protein n=1 Tax=Hesseltinella vesiculosa TaxID=101127 RepID=A0A1X2GV35_9FUNG|nr:hypothetical protein DM01DRAFT_1331368 [Hesseltinella vesiculosa]